MIPLFQTPANVPYNLNNMKRDDYSHKKQSRIVANLLGGRTKGFFVECGAYDGETYSNSLYFEKTLGWSGMLIEPDHRNMKILKSKNRRAWVVNGCVDGSIFGEIFSKKSDFSNIFLGIQKPKRMIFFGAMDAGILRSYSNWLRNAMTWFWRPVKETEVWCFPLHSLLLAANK